MAISRFFLPLFFAPFVCAQLHIVGADSILFSAASPACLQALNLTVACNDTLTTTNPSSNYDQDFLDGLCQKNCLPSLKAYRARVAARCPNFNVNIPDSDLGSLPVTSFADSTIYTYSMTCMKSRDGKYCNEWFQSIQKTDDANIACHECNLSFIQGQLNSPFGAYDLQAAQSFSSLTASCSATDFPVTSPTSIGNSVTTATGAVGPSVSQACSSSYTVASSDDCHSIAISHSVSTDSILRLNNLPGRCVNFPPAGTTLCIGGKCKVYTVRAGDTCDSITTAANITTAQFVRWNANLNPSCTNLGDYVGFQFCVSNPGGDYVMPTDAPAMPGESGAVTATGSFIPMETNWTAPPGQTWASTLIFPEIWAPDHASGVSNLPKPTGNSSSSRLPIYPSARKDCYSYAPRLSPRDTSCWALAAGNYASKTDFLLWNGIQAPAGTKSGNFSWNCELQPTYVYCVKLIADSQVQPTRSKEPDAWSAVTGIPDDTNEDCGGFYTVSSNRVSCGAILKSFNITLAQFYSWNPSVGNNCQSMLVGKSYCIQVDEDDIEGTAVSPTPTATSPNPIGTSPTSTATETGTGTLLGPTGTGAGTSPEPTGTGTGIPPGPTGTGTAADCKKYVIVKKEDTCQSISVAAGISPANFYRMNTGTGRDCKGLVVGNAVCVAR